MDQTPFEQPDWLNEIAGILEKLNQGVIIDDARGRIMFANEIFLRMLGRPANEIMGRSADRTFDPVGKSECPVTSFHVQLLCFGRLERTMLVHIR